MNLTTPILRAIYLLGFTNPTTLQKQTCVHYLNEQDMIVFAGSGTGRTVMFTIQLLERINLKLRACQALVLVPTQHVAKHIREVCYL